MASRWHHIALGTAGSDASNRTDRAVPAGFANFHGVTVESMIWLDNTATVRNQQHFDDVGQRKYYVDMFRLQAPSVSAPLPPYRSRLCAPELPFVLTVRKQEHFDSVGQQERHGNMYRLQAP